MFIFLLMAQITINIPVDKEDWVLDGFAERFGYLVNVSNPLFDEGLPEDPDTNPLTIPNPESKQAFAKRMIIDLIKDYANQGHNRISLNNNAVNSFL